LQAAPAVSASTAQIADQGSPIWVVVPKVNGTIAKSTDSSSALDSSSLLKTPTMARQTAPAPAKPVQVALTAGSVGAAKLAQPKVAVKVEVSTQRVRMASANVDGALGSTTGSTLKMPFMVRQSGPARATTIDMTGIAHHTVDVFSPSVTARVRGSYMLVMDDHAVKLSQPLQDHDSVLCAPLRQIFESQGGVLDWSGKTKEVRAITATRVVSLKIGSRTAHINGEATTLKTAPYLSQNRTMIPVGFLPLALNVSVSYDPASGHLLINSKG
jgi:hypothetical protein